MVLATDPVRELGLASLVQAAGHEVSKTDPQVMLADADALHRDDVVSSVPIVALGDPGVSYAGHLPSAPNVRQLDAALRAVAAGLIVHEPALEPPRSGFHSVEVESPLLTPREVEVLAAIGTGLSNKEVARQLGISAHTVKFHLESAFRKLDAGSRAEAVAKGLRRGLIEV